MRRKLDLLKAAALDVYKSVRENPQKTKRVLKVALALTLAVGLTLPPPIAAFLGQNPFLVGTIVRTSLPMSLTTASFAAMTKHAHNPRVSVGLETGNRYEEMPGK
jgi:hypothetical protein